VSNAISSVPQKYKIAIFWAGISVLISAIGSHAFAQGPSAHAMNPDVGANFLIEGRRGSVVRGTDQGIHVRETEFSFKSDVDPYLTANMIFSVAPTDANPREYTIEPEEAYVDTTFIPNVTLRAGKFYGFFGRHNILHTHAFPFIDAPLISQALLGGGLNSGGISASYLIPTHFFSELTVQGFENFYTLAHLRTLFDLDDDSTLELGISGVTKWAWGTDVTFKHRPTGVGMGRKFNLAGEWMSGQLDGYTTAPTADGKPTRGFGVYGQYEFLARTFAQYRFDDLISGETTRHGICLAYAPSEFSVFRLEYDHTRSPSSDPDNRVLAQINITIGFHPAHDY
jgi:hypothetical protein